MIQCSECEMEFSDDLYGHPTKPGLACAMCMGQLVPGWKPPSSGTDEAGFPMAQVRSEDGLTAA